MANAPQKYNGLVYSTEKGRMCPFCGQALSGCRCRVKETVSQGDGIIRVGRRTKGCKGKGLTVITGLPLEPDSLAQLARQLKQRCGAGGTCKDGIIEIQGDHRDLLVEELTRLGYKVKRAGG